MEPSSETQGQSVGSGEWAWTIWLIKLLRPKIISCQVSQRKTLWNLGTRLGQPLPEYWAVLKGKGGGGGGGLGVAFYFHFFKGYKIFEVIKKRIAWWNRNVFSLIFNGHYKIEQLNMAF